MSTRVFPAPVACGEICQYCLHEIAVTAEIAHSLAVKGLRELVWVHVATHSEECVHTFRAKPYDAWRATRSFEDALNRERHQ